MLEITRQAIVNVSMVVYQLYGKAAMCTVADRTALDVYWLLEAASECDELPDAREYVCEALTMAQAEYGKIFDSAPGHYTFATLDPLRSVVQRLSQDLASVSV